MTDDAKLTIIAYGTAAQIAKGAVKRASDGLKVGLLVPNVAVPRWIRSVGQTFWFEMNTGQMVDDVHWPSRAGSCEFTDAAVRFDPAEIADHRTVLAAEALDEGRIHQTEIRNRCQPLLPGLRTFDHPQTHLRAGRRDGHRENHLLPAGCAVLAYNYFDFDVCESAHGRGCAIATGFKGTARQVVFTYQGDGDMAAIGTAEPCITNRGEKITSIFVNNAVYGMTSGQIAPTMIARRPAPPVQENRRGRIPFEDHRAHRQLPGAAYVSANIACHLPKSATPKAIRKAFEVNRVWATLW